MARVQRAPAGCGGMQRGGGRCAHEAAAVAVAVVVAEESQHGGRAAVELAESALEAGAGDEAAPRLADERGAEEARGLLRREAEEDLFDKLLHQRRRRRRRQGRLRHGCSSVMVLLGGQTDTASWFFFPTKAIIYLFISASDSRPRGQDPTQIPNTSHVPHTHIHF